MRKVILSVSALLLIGSGRVLSADRVLRGGQPVQVRLTSVIDTKQARKTPPILTAIVDQDVREEGGSIVLIRRGTPVMLESKVQKAKGVGKPGYVALRCLSVQAIDGQTITIQGGLEQTGASRKGTALGVGLGVGLTVFWPALGCLFIKGEHVVIPENTMIHNVVVNGNYTVALAE